MLAANNVPVVLHEGTTQDLPQVGLDRFDNFLFPATWSPTPSNSRWA